MNGEWLLDNGNKMPVTGEKGETGNKGTDAIAPQVRINEDTGFWEISTDGGNLWNSTGVKATGDAGDSFFQKAPELSEDNLYYIFTLTNGDEIEIPNYLSRGLIFMQNGQPLTDLVTKIIVTDGELTFSAPENMQVSTHILEGDGWSTKIENNTIKLEPNIDPAILEVTLSENGKVIETYHLNLSLFYGSGTTSDPYQITSTEDFIIFSEQNSPDKTFSDIYFILTNNIDLTDTEFKPIEYFSGSFDGQNNSVRGLNIVDESQYKNIGLFCIVNNGTVSNLNVEGTVHRVSKRSDQDGFTNGIGGVVGVCNNGTIKNCTFKGSVMSEANEVFDYIGGVVGCIQMNSAIIGCGNLASPGGSINVVQSQTIGGVVGFSISSHIIGCYNTGDIVCQNKDNTIGGVTGGLDSNTIIACYNTGTITVPLETRNAAGVIGNASFKIIVTACYDATNNNEDVYAIGAMASGPSAVENTRFNTCYWLTADNRIGIGYSGGNYDRDAYKDIAFPDCTTKSEAELKSQTTVDALNNAIDTWNSANDNLCTYRFEVDKNGGYPVLISQD